MVLKNYDLIIISGSFGKLRMDIDYDQYLDKFLEKIAILPLIVIPSTS